MIQTHFLAGSSLFTGLDEPELSRIAEIGRMERKGPEERIFREGDPAEEICIVVEGRVELRYELPGRESTREQVLTVIEAGKPFGWSALVPPYKLTLSSYAGEAGCRFIRIKAAELVELFERSPRIGYACMKNLTRVIAERFHSMENEVARLEGLDVMHRW